MGTKKGPCLIAAEPTFEEELPFVFIVANGLAATGFHAFLHGLCLKAFVVFFNRAAFVLFFFAPFAAFATLLFFDAHFGLHRFFAGTGAFIILSKKTRTGKTEQYE